MKKLIPNQPKKARVKKFTISFPREICEKIEYVQSHEGLSRSAAIASLVDDGWEKRAEMEMERKYSEGYRQKPERPVETDALYKAGLKSFTPEKW